MLNLRKSAAAQRLRRVSKAAAIPSSFPAVAPRGFVTKDLSSDKQQATIEVVSDDDKDNIDILPQDSTLRIEPTVIVEPKPSVPSYIYNPIIDFAGSAAGVADNDGDGNNNKFHFNENDMNDGIAFWRALLDRGYRVGFNLHIICRMKNEYRMKKLT